MSSSYVPPNHYATLGSEVPTVDFSNATVIADPFFTTPSMSMAPQKTTITDRDVCYWLDGSIDRRHSNNKDLVSISGSGIMRKIEDARLNRSDGANKYTLFCEWLAGMLEMWGHLNEEKRRIANDSIRRHLEDVLRI